MDKLYEYIRRMSGMNSNWVYRDVRDGTSRIRAGFDVGDRA